MTLAEEIDNIVIRLTLAAVLLRDRQCAGAHRPARCTHRRPEKRTIDLTDLARWVPSARLSVVGSARREPQETQPQRKESNMYAIEFVESVTGARFTSASRFASKDDARAVARVLRSDLFAKGLVVPFGAGGSAVVSNLSVVSA